MKVVPIVLSVSLLLSGSATAAVCMNNIPASNPDVAYTIHGDGTVTDTRTALMWKLCAEGQTWNAGTCTGTEATFTWDAALARAEIASDFGYSDWRLPNIKELLSLVEECRTSPSVNSSVFPAAPTSAFWSSSPVGYDSYNGWYVRFDNGKADYGGFRGNSLSIRLVRGEATAIQPSGTVVPLTARVDVLQQFTVTGTGFTGTTQFAVDGCDGATTPVVAGSTQATFSCTPRLPGPAQFSINGSPIANSTVFVDNPVRQGDPARGGIPEAKGVSLWNGNFHHEVVDMEVPGIGLPFVLSRSYNSYYWAPVSARGGVDNYHPWRFNWDLKIGYVNGNTTQIYMKREDGSGATFYKDTDNVWYPIDHGSFETLRGDVPAAGQTTVTGRDGRLYVFQNPDLGGRLLAVKDHDGHALTTAYDGSGRLTSVTDTAGRVFAFTWGSNGLLQRVTDPTGRYVEYTWESDTAPNTGDARDRIKTVRDVRGGVTTYWYDVKAATATLGPRVLLNRIVDPMNYDAVRLTYTDQAYDNWGVASVKDALNNTWSFTYCAETATGTCGTTDLAQSFRTNVTAPIAAASYKAHFDTAGRYTGKTDGLSHRSYVAPKALNELTRKTYNWAGLTVGRTTAMTFQTTYQHHSSGNVGTRINPDGGENDIKVWQEDAARNLYLPTETWSAACADVSQTCVKQYSGYDTTGKLLTRRVGALPASTNTYNPTSFLLASSTDPLGNTTQYTYDAAGNLTNIYDPYSQLERYTYDGIGRITRKLDRRGTYTDYTYDAAGNVLTETLDSGSGRLNLVTSYSYDANGNQTSRTDPKGNIVYTDYDAANRPWRVRRTVNSVAWQTTSVYDALGRVTSTTNANNHAQTTAYDAAGNVWSRNDALSRTTTYEYDPDNRVTKQTDPEGRVTTYTYDSMGRTTAVTTPDGTVTSAYDKDGRLILQTDKKGQATTFGYDTAGRQISVTDPAGAVTRMTYYDDGNLNTVADPRGNVTSYQYDKLGRRTRIADAKARFWSTTYDTIGKVVTTTNPNGQTASYSYDTAHRLIGISWSDGSSVSYTLDRNGNRTSVTEGTSTTAYTYDELDRIKSVTDPNGQMVTYVRDGVGNVTTLGYPGNRNVGYQYDAVDRMVRLTDWAGRATNWTLDRSDRVTQVAHGNGTSTIMAYDTAGRLDTLSVRQPNAAIIAAWNVDRDANGNITHADATLPLQPVAGASGSWSYDTDNRQSGVTYDTAGRVTSGGGHSLAWNAREQVTSVDGNAQTYTADGLRVAQTVGSVTTRFVIDRAAGLPNVLVDTDAANSAQRYYLHSAYGLVEQIDAAGTPRFYHYDTNGNTVALTDASGNITDRYAYTPFGETTAQGSTGNPFRFVGQFGVRNFNGTGLYDMRARWYDSATARFLSLDPLLGETDRPQSLNRYAYVEGNPMLFSDPSGYISWSKYFPAATEILGKQQKLYDSKDVSRTEYAFNTVWNGSGLVPGLFVDVASNVTAGLSASADAFERKLTESSCSTMRLGCNSEALYYTWGDSYDAGLAIGNSPRMRTAVAWTQIGMGISGLIKDYSSLNKATSSTVLWWRGFKTNYAVNLKYPSGLFDFIYSGSDVVKSVIDESRNNQFLGDVYFNFLHYNPTTWR